MPLAQQSSSDSLLRFVEPPSVRQLMDGSIELEARFECDATVAALVPTHVVWRHGERVIHDIENSSSPRHSVAFLPRGDGSCSSVLRIEEPSQADAGLYRCEVVTAEGLLTALVDVPEIVFKKPSFVQKTGFHTRDNGRLVIMDFRIRSPVEAKAEWREDGKVLTPKSSSVNITWKKEPGDTYYGALMLCLPPNYNERVFECRISNEFGQLLATFNGKDDTGCPRLIRPLNGRHLIKDHVHIAIFEVGFQSSSQPTIHWWNPKGKKLQVSGRVKLSLTAESPDVYTARMQLANWGERDAGRYTCTIENESGRTAMDVVFRDVDHVGRLMSRLFSYDIATSASERRGSSPC